MNLRLPPLRERPGDIVALAEHFSKKYAAANGIAERPISAEARRRLVAHRWPGNVRELENAMHRAVLLAIGPEIEEYADPAAGRRADAGAAGAETARAASHRRRDRHAAPSSARPWRRSSSS